LYLLQSGLVQGLPALWPPINHDLNFYPSFFISFFIESWVAMGSKECCFSIEPLRVRPCRYKHMVVTKAKASIAFGIRIPISSGNGLEHVDLKTSIRSIP
ncbi:hypothetical protein, partial [Desulfocicer niacini]